MTALLRSALNVGKKHDRVGQLVEVLSRVFSAGPNVSYAAFEAPLRFVPPHRRFTLIFRFGRVVYSRFGIKDI